MAVAVVKRVFGATTGFLSGMAASGLLVGRDAVMTRSVAKLLEVGTLLLFPALAL